jgi:hypothetical protein
MSRTIPPRASVDDSPDIVPLHRERLPDKFADVHQGPIIVFRLGYFTFAASFLFALASIFFFSDSESLLFLTI